MIVVNGSTPLDFRQFTQSNRLVIGTIVEVIGPPGHAMADQYSYDVAVRFDQGEVVFNNARPFNPRPMVEVEPYPRGQLVIGVIDGYVANGFGIAFIFNEREWYDDCDGEGA